MERNAERDAELIKSGKSQTPVKFLFFFKYDGQASLQHDTKDCAVCHMDFANGENIVVLRCKHLYHQACMEKVIKAQHTVCPLCRGDF